jgi:hypothetical protein
VNPEPATPDRLDPLAARDALDPGIQRRIGAAAIALTVAIVAIEGLMSGNGTQLIELSVQEASNFHKQSLRYAKAVAASSGRLMELAGTCLGYGNGKLPPVPDLRPLGIRQCRSCGCTGAHACEGGCYWVETDLRSACVPGAAPS